MSAGTQQAPRTAARAPAEPGGCRCSPRRRCRAIGWFEFLYLLPLLLGVAGLLAQPARFGGDPPAPIAR